MNWLAYLGNSVKKSNAREGWFIITGSSARSIFNAHRPRFYSENYLYIEEYISTFTDWRVSPRVICISYYWIGIERIAKHKCETQLE